MPKSKKRTYRRRKTIKRKPKRSKNAGMHNPDLSFFADFTDAKNTMVGANEAKELKSRIHKINKLEEKVNLLKGYLRYNKNSNPKLMPTEKIKDILKGKDLYDMPVPLPATASLQARVRRAQEEAQRYYDLLEDEYYELLHKYDLRYLKELRKRMKRRFKGLDSYHKHAEKYENRIGVHKPETIGNF